MTAIGDAYAVASAIYAGTKGEAIVDIDDLSDRLYTVLNSINPFHHDEARADLYAQLAEKLTHATPFEEAVAIIEHAIEQTRLHA